MKPLICLPTFNEIENIEKIIFSILDHSSAYQVLVIDDSSPDGTGELVKKLKSDNPFINNKVHILNRTKKNGRGGAVWDGIQYGIDSLDVDCFIEMDCDFSHDPKYIIDGLDLLEEGYDSVIASRYPYGGVVGWPISRRVLSFMANQLIKNLISTKYHDYTNGMRFYSYHAAKIILNKGIQYPGYINLSETLSILIKSNLKIGSFDMVFVNRTEGKSSLNIQELINALFSIIKIAYRFRFK
jgi:glycosyltransferase involved in cell wall biosynthesis